MYSGFFREKHGTWASFRGIWEPLVKRGLFDSIYVDPDPQDRRTASPTQFERAMEELEIIVMPECSPQARDRCDRLFRILRQCLPPELARARIDGISHANAWIQRYWPKLNAFLAVEPWEASTSFHPIGPSYWTKLTDILCLKKTARVGSDNRVSHGRTTLLIPVHEHQLHFEGEEVRVHQYQDGKLAVFHGRLLLGRYDHDGTPLGSDKTKAWHELLGLQ